MTSIPVSTSVKGLFLMAMVLSGAAIISACDSADDSDSVAELPASAENTARQAPAGADSAAKEADGVITATFNGTERIWYITSAEKGGQQISQSDWSPLFGDQSNVSIMGHVSPSWPFKSGEAILIGFTLQGTGENPSVGDPSITYLSGGITNNHSSSHDGTAKISVSRASIDGDILTISGTLSGTLPFKSMTGDADVESEETIVVEGGTFEGEVRRLQE